MPPTTSQSSTRRPPTCTRPPRRARVSRVGFGEGGAFPGREAGAADEWRSGRGVGGQVVSISASESTRTVRRTRWPRIGMTWRGEDPSGTAPPKAAPMASKMCAALKCASVASDSLGLRYLDPLTCPPTLRAGWAREAGHLITSPPLPPSSLGVAGAASLAADAATPGIAISLSSTMIDRGQSVSDKVVVTRGAPRQKVTLQRKRDSSWVCIATKWRSFIAATAASRRPDAAARLCSWAHPARPRRYGLGLSSAAHQAEEGRQPISLLPLPTDQPRRDS
jgi:hypothetical protein